MSDDFEDCQMTDDDLIRRGDALDAIDTFLMTKTSLDVELVVRAKEAIAALPAVTPATSPGVTAGAVGEWLPCPLCGDEIETEGDGVEHRASDTCPLDSMFMLPEHREAWNRRATPATALDDPRVRKLVKALKAAKVGFYELANQIDDEDYKGPLDGFVVPVVCHAKPYHEKQIANAIAYGEACSAALRDMEGA